MSGPGPHVIGGSPEARAVIERAVALLPQAVQAFAATEIEVLVTKALGARAVPLPRPARWLVVVAEQRLVEPDDGVSVVLHEIGHCWLGHTLSPGDAGAAAAQDAAWALAKQWAGAPVGLANELAVEEETQ